MATNVEKLITALVTPFQDLEDTLQQLLTERGVDTAIGEQLTAIGKLVGRARNGVTDDEVFRSQVRAQIATNKSDGTTEDLITISTLVINDDNATIVINNTGIASVEVHVTGVTVTDLHTTLLSFLKKAVAAGVRLVLLTDPSADETELFDFAGIPFAEFVDKVSFVDLVPGTSGNGRHLTIIDAGFGVAGYLDESDPMDIIVGINIQAGDFTPDTTWSGFVTLVNGSAYIRIQELMTSGTMSADDLGIVVFDGGVDGVGLGFADSLTPGTGGQLISAMD